MNKIAPVTRLRIKWIRAHCYHAGLLSVHSWTQYVLSKPNWKERTETNQPPPIIIRREAITRIWCEMSLRRQQWDSVYVTLIKSNYFRTSLYVLCISVLVPRVLMARREDVFSGWIFAVCGLMEPECVFEYMLLSASNVGQSEKSVGALCCKGHDHGRARWLWISGGRAGDERT